MNFAGILAGGKGLRMGDTDVPKQFLQLADGTPILICTLRAFLNCPRIDQIIVACPHEWKDHTVKLCKEWFRADELDRISLVDGGDSRNASLENICLFITRNYPSDEKNILVSHDAVRPFVTQRIIEDNIEAVLQYGCSDTVVPATDTIVVSSDGDVIDSIPDRSHYFLGQTPQGFFIDEYLDLYSSLTAAEKASLTDACKVYSIRQRPVHLVDGEYSNIKITTPHDIYVATTLMTTQGDK
jgi:2-C-methyl-D-erythritol 4-phosphate cytidylyltransferase